MESSKIVENVHVARCVSVNVHSVPISFYGKKETIKNPP